MDEVTVYAIKNSRGEYLILRKDFVAWSHRLTASCLIHDDSNYWIYDLAKKYNGKVLYGTATLRESKINAPFGFVETGDGFKWEGN